MARRGTRLRPTLRGACVLMLALALWLLGDVGGLGAPVDLAAGLLLALALSLAVILLAGLGLDLRRSVAVPEVVAPGSVPVLLELADGALLRRLPLGTAQVRSDLPAALGGTTDLAVRPRMPHRLTVTRRGIHPLGPCRIDVVDPLGMFRLRRTVSPGGEVVALPAAEPLDAELLARAGLMSLDATSGPGGAGLGEIGPLARLYAPGDDVRHVHWRASARTGRLMTREDEPAMSRRAVIVLEDRRPGIPDDESAAARTRREDRMVGAALSLEDALRRHGWDVRLLDGDGREIAPAGDVPRALATLPFRDAPAGREGRSLPPVSPETSLLVAIVAGRADDGGFPAVLGGQGSGPRPEQRVALVFGPGDPRRPGSAGSVRTMPADPGPSDPGVAGPEVPGPGVFGPGVLGLGAFDADGWRGVEIPPGVSLTAAIASLIEHAEVRT